MIFFLAVISAFYLASVLLLLRGLLSLPKTGDPANLNFSVVIAAHNEENNIGACLDSILAQNMPPDRLEIIVVNDRSTDRTAEVVSGYISLHRNISLINIERTPPGLSPKKYAVSKGIEVSKGEVIVFTDADCRVPERWLDTIDRSFTPETGLVQGITCYERPPAMNSLFFGLQAVDFLSHGIVAAAGIGAGMPINSNANNMAFRRSAFAECGGYGKSAGKVVSGDDDLLMQKIWKSGKWKIRYMADLKGAVTTAPADSVRSVFEQRKRWGSKTVHYNPMQVLFLSCIFLFYLAIPVTLFCGFFKPWYFSAAILMLLVKFVGEMVLMIPGSRIFGKQELRRYILPGSIIQLPMVLMAVFLGVFGKFNWKGREFSRTVGSHE
jgi:cellulose synthase/poly-beta-1,6-N-acetylglucosamine synthase-like glycosyltransferase